MTTIYVEVPAPLPLSNSRNNFVTSKVAEAMCISGITPYLAMLDKRRGVLIVYGNTGREPRDTYHRVAKPLHLLISNRHIDLRLRDPENVAVGNWMDVATDAYYIVFSEEPQTFEAYMRNRV